MVIPQHHHTVRLCAVILFIFSANLHSQPAQPSRVIGEVLVINGTRELTVKTDKGDPVTFALGEKTRYLRVQPGEKDLKNASRINLTDVSTGDRVLGLGSLSADSKTLAATSIIVMSKADLAKKQEHEREEWQTRGITGVVAAVNADAKEFTVSVHTAEGTKAVVVESAEKVDFRRWAPDSVRFKDAKPGTFAELKAGDNVRVLGEKNADGTRMKPEAVVSGTFRTLAATVISVDGNTGEIRATNLANKKPIVVRVNADTAIHRLPQPAAMRLAFRYNPEYVRSLRQGGGGPRGGGGGGAAGAGPRGGGPGAMRSTGSQGGDLQQALENVPPMQVAELKKDDAILVSSTVGADPSQITAITLVAGVEPLLTKPSGERINLDWSLDMSPPAQ